MLYIPRKMSRIMWPTLSLLVIYLGFSMTQFKKASADGLKSSLSMKNTGIRFSCPAYKSKHQPTSVHRLMPGDIRVIAALGDSITAGVGIDSTDNATENRGLVFSIGAEDRVDSMVTIPAILKKYNTDLVGYSYGAGTSDLPISGFNVAIQGAKSQDMVMQVDALIDRLQTNSNVDMERDWKLITVYVGLHDLCASCYDVEKYSSFNYVTNIGRALDILKDKVPRAFVNVMPVFDVSVLRKMDADNNNCQNMRSETCPCIVNKDDARLVSEMSQRYQDQLAAEIDNGKYDTDTFAVVLQRQLENINFLSLSDGRPDPTFLSNDCILLSREGHQKTAIALWNSMFTAVGNEKKIETEVKLMCPGEGTYFYTNLNPEPYLYEVDLKETVEGSTKMEKSHDKLHLHPYYAVIFITVFMIMVALVVAVIIYLTVKDFTKERQIKMYDFSFFDDDNDDCYK